MTIVQLTHHRDGRALFFVPTNITTWSENVNAKVGGTVVFSASDCQPDDTGWTVSEPPQEVRRLVETALRS